MQGDFPPVLVPLPSFKTNKTGKNPSCLFGSPKGTRSARLALLSRLCGKRNTIAFGRLAFAGIYSLLCKATFHPFSSPYLLSKTNKTGKNPSCLFGSPKGTRSARLALLSRLCGKRNTIAFGRLAFAEIYSYLCKATSHPFSSPYLLSKQTRRAKTRLVCLVAPRGLEPLFSP